MAAPAPPQEEKKEGILAGIGKFVEEVTGNDPESLKAEETKLVAALAAANEKDPVDLDEVKDAEDALNAHRKKMTQKGVATSGTMGGRRRKRKGGRHTKRHPKKGGKKSRRGRTGRKASRL